MSPLDVWYERLDVQTLIEMAPNAEDKKAPGGDRREGAAAHRRISVPEDQRRRSVDGSAWWISRRCSFMSPTKDAEEMFREALEDYRQSLPDDRRVLFDRYRLEDCAIKVVGIGSVGTRCLRRRCSSPRKAIRCCCNSRRRAPRCSQPYAGKSVYENQGQRVVVGQRLMQSASDIFLGWTRGRRGSDFFVRQLRDMKMSFPIEGMSAVAA